MADRESKLVGEGESLWRFIFGTLEKKEEAAYREHYLAADLRRVLGIAWVSAGLMVAIDLRDMSYIDQQPELWIGILIRTITLVISILIIWRLRKDPNTRQMDLAMVSLAFSIMVGMLWIHYAQEVSAARMVSIGTIVIMAAIIGLPTYPILPLMSALVIILGDGWIIYQSNDTALQEMASLIMIAYIFSALFGVVTSANQHRARYETFKARSQIKTLEGILPICAHCKKIRDDEGYYQQLESYFSKYAGATFSHGICPECVVIHYSELEP